jgi:hypothetical protein
LVQEEGSVLSAVASVFGNLTMNVH